MNTDDLSDDELARARTVAEIVKLNEETRKFVAESHKLTAEGSKLAEEGRKLARERWWHGAVVGAAILGAGATATLLLLRVTGTI